MNKTTWKLSILLLMFIFAGGAAVPESVLAQEKKATKIRLEQPDNGFWGTVFITINGKEKELAESGGSPLIINDGRDVVYIAWGGAGGFEDEGQSLKIYNVATDSTRKILSEYYMIDAFAEHKLSNGKRAILVRMSDGGLGASYFAVVDPERGEVFFRKWAEVLKISGDKITLGTFEYGEDSVRDEFPTEIIAKPTGFKPTKTETLDLTKILKNEVIYNEHTITPYLEENVGLKRVEIYLWRPRDEMTDRDFVILPVPRYVDPQAPLRPTLEALFGKVNEEETEYGFSTPVFGLKFEGVGLKNGTATVKFSQPSNKLLPDKSAPFIFEEAIKKTALQFPTVKRVEICSVGQTSFNSQDPQPFAKYCE